jgi:hypothetical protein
MDRSKLEAMLASMASLPEFSQPSDYEPQLYRSPINLPEGQSGKLRVVHEMMTGKLPIVGIRQAINTGRGPVHAVITEPLRIHKLVEEGRGVWMTDMPEELDQIGQLLHDVRPHGHVLVGGLGLGVLAATLATAPQVSTITVIERSADVIKLCKADGYVVRHADIFDYLTRSPVRHDFYLLDTWQATSESEWWRSVMPMKRIIRNRWGSRPVIHCWAEDIMAGQVFRSLMAGHRQWYYKGLPQMTEREARYFIMEVGSPRWEKLYGGKLCKMARQHSKRLAPAAK